MEPAETGAVRRDLVDPEISIRWVACQATCRAGASLNHDGRPHLETR